MPYQLKPLFSGEKRVLPVEEALDLSGLDLQGVHPFPDPVAVSGSLRPAAGGLVTLQAEVRYVHASVCARCLAEFRRPGLLRIARLLSERAEDAGEDADVLPVPDGILNLEDVVRDDLLLELPVKSLCRDDCRGLCMLCGRDLNTGLCGCRADTADPRLAKLGELLE